MLTAGVIQADWLVGHNAYDYANAQGWIASVKTFGGGDVYTVDSDNERIYSFFALQNYMMYSALYAAVTFLNSQFIISYNATIGNAINAGLVLANNVVIANWIIDSKSGADQEKQTLDEVYEGVKEQISEFSDLDKTATEADVAGEFDGKTPVEIEQNLEDLGTKIETQPLTAAYIPTGTLRLVTTE